MIIIEKLINLNHLIELYQEKLIAIGIYRLFAGKFEKTIKLKIDESILQDHDLVYSWHLVKFENGSFYIQEVCKKLTIEQFKKVLKLKAFW